MTSDFRILPSRRVLPGRQAHVELGRIGGGVDQFRRRLAGDGPVQLVLHGGEELLGQRRVGVVIHRQGVDVRDLLVKAPLAGPDFPDALQQFVEVILAEDLLALLQPLVIQHEALDDELPQGLGRPDAELRGLVAVDPVADGDDGVEVVELHLARDLAAALGTNYFHFGNSCLLGQLAGLEDVLQVLVDGRHLDAEQLRQRLLRQPDRLVLEEDLHLHRPVRRGVEEKLVLAAHRETSSWGIAGFSRRID